MTAASGRACSGTAKTHSPCPDRTREMPCSDGAGALLPSQFHDTTQRRRLDEDLVNRDLELVLINQLREDIRLSSADSKVVIASILLGIIAAGTVAVWALGGTRVATPWTIAATIICAVLLGALSKSLLNISHAVIRYVTERRLLDQFKAHAMAVCSQIEHECPQSRDQIFAILGELRGTLHPAMRLLLARRLWQLSVSLPPARAQYVATEIVAWGQSLQGTSMMAEIVRTT